MFEIAVYLYLRYGELPYELDNEEKLYKLGNLLKRYDSLFNEMLNKKVEVMRDERKEDIQS